MNAELKKRYEGKEDLWNALSRKDLHERRRTLKSLIEEEQDILNDINDTDDMEDMVD